MKYSLIEEAACKRVFKVELDAHEVHHARDHAYRHVAERADLPGFRKGKVPAHVLEQRFGKQLEEETVEHALGHAAQAVIQGTGLQPITNPSVASIQHAKDGMTFALTIELAPQIVLEEYRGLAFDREPVIVRPEDVDAVIDGLRRRMTSYAPAGRPARWGDLAVLDYDGTVGGRPFDGSRGRDVAVFIGAGETMRQIEEALVGRSAGDAFTLDVTYDADHVNEALRGKTAALSVTLKELKTGKPPELDDAFAAQVGTYTTLEEVRAAVGARLRAEREKEVHDRLRATVVDRLIRFAPAEVAPSMVDDEMQYMAVRGAEELARQGMKQIEQLRMNPQSFREMFRPAAVRAVREAFVLEAISRKEGLTVTDEDLDREIRQGREGGEVPERLVAQLKADGRWERLRHRLLQDRTLDWVIAQARISERALCL